MTLVELDACSRRARRAWRSASSSASSGRPIASHSRPNTVSALAAISTSAAVAGRVHVRRRDAGQHRAGAAAGDAADLVVGHRRLHERGDRLVDGDVDLLAVPLRRRSTHRGQGADHGEHGRERVAQADAGARTAGGRGCRWCGGCRPSPRRCCRSRPRPPAARSGRSRDVHHDQARVAAPTASRSRGPTPRACRAGSSRGRRRPRRQPADQAAALRGAQVDRDRPLVPGDRRATTGSRRRRRRPSGASGRRRPAARP